LNSDRYRIETNPSADDLRFLENQIDEFNVEATNNRDFAPLAIFVRNESSIIIAGISGYTWGGCCEIKFLWVHPQYRQSGLGGSLLQAAEAEARQRACHLIVLDTYSFQAPQFYPKFGYTVIGTYEDCPSGHRKYYLEKRLERTRS
jgi:GNAT superfamily N-acetyltransferase